MIIAGAKGFAKELLEVVYRDYKYKDIIFYDDISKSLPDTLFGRFKVIKTKENLRISIKSSAYFVLGVGIPKVRSQLYKLFIDNGGIIKTIISNMASIGSFETEVSNGCTIMDGVMITNNVKIGECCLINANTIIAHDSIIGKFSDIAPNVTISGSCKIGDFVSIGTGAIILPGVNIGNNVIIGAASVIKNHIPDNSLVIGSPGKVIKELPGISSD